MTLTELLRKIKTEYGINQTMLAQKMGVSPQILTDVKAGRRRFTVSMAEAIMKEFHHQREAPWLSAALTGILSDGLRTAAGEEKRLKAISAPAIGDSTTIRLPVLDALCKGDPLKAPGNTGKIAPIPDVLAPFLADGADPYVLAFDNADCSGRLRAGDQVLIVQNYLYPKEIMVVECEGRLRMARKPICAVGYNGVERWLALETGMPLDTVIFVGAAVGIVAAIL